MVPQHCGGGRRRGEGSVRRERLVRRVVLEGRVAGDGMASDLASSAYSYSYSGVGRVVGVDRPVVELLLVVVVGGCGGGGRHLVLVVLVVGRRAVGIMMVVVVVEAASAVVRRRRRRNGGGRGGGGGSVVVDQALQPADVCSQSGGGGGRGGGGHPHPHAKAGVHKSAGAEHIHANHFLITPQHGKLERDGRDRIPLSILFPSPFSLSVVPPLDTGVGALEKRPFFPSFLLSPSQSSTAERKEEENPRSSS